MWSLSTKLWTPLSPNQNNFSTYVFHDCSVKKYQSSSNYERVMRKGQPLNSQRFKTLVLELSFELLKAKLGGEMREFQGLIILLK
jgi:hypothetical protein